MADRTEFKVIGKWHIPSKPSYSVITGSAKYSGEVVYPDTLYGDIVRSPYARARIKSMDVSAARALPGVKAVITWDDEELVNYNSSLINQPSAILPNEGRHERSECAAAVAAETPEICEEAIKLIADSIEWEELTHILDPREAAKDGATLLNPDVNSDNNIGGVDDFEKGNIEDGFAASDDTIEFDVSWQTTGFLKSRNRVCTARWENESGGNEGASLFYDGYLRFVKSTGMAAFGLPDHKVHPASVLEGSLFCEHGGGAAFIIAPILAKRTGRHVVMMHSRQNMFGWSGSGNAYVNLKVGYDNDGTINAVYMKAICSQGSIGHFNTVRLGDSLRLLNSPI
jgi:xanthine dehydrogenase molybdenum-binding subunit